MHSQLFLISWKLWCGLFTPMLQNGVEGDVWPFISFASFPAGRAGMSLAPLVIDKSFLKRSEV